MKGIKSHLKNKEFLESNTACYDIFAIIKDCDV
jgi:hypothetical protein